MKNLKRGLQVIGVLLFMITISVLVFLAADAHNTAFLKIKNHPGLNKTSYLITNVNIVPMYRDTVLLNKTVYVKDGIIENIADSIPVKGAKIIDGENRFLSPGLIDMHVHVWDKYELGLYLSNGVTAIRNVWGMPMHIRMKQEINDEKIIAPLFFTTGPKLTGPEFIGDDNLQLTSAEQAKEKVISYKARGYDFIKTYYGLTQDLYDAILRQAKISEIDLVAHPSQKVPYQYHFNPQIISIEHVEDIVQLPLNYQPDSVKLNKVIADFKNNPHTSFCPTAIAFYNIYNMLQDDQILSKKSVRLMNPLIRKTDSKGQFERWHSTKERDSLTMERIRRQHEFHLAIIKGLHDAGVNIICGTDAGIGVTVPGYSIHRELALYKEAGMSNYEALKTATLNPSKTHKQFAQMGTIQKGKQANFILTSGNPLRDIDALREPEWVMVKGRKINKETLKEFTDRSRDRNNLAVTAFHYAEYMIVEK